MKKQICSNIFRKTGLTIFCCFFIITIYSQAQKFNFGFQGAAYLSQVEGDNLIGFSKIGYGIGLLGGYNFNDNTEFIFSGQYEKIGSDRSGAKVSRQAFRPLTQIDLQVLSIYLAFSRKFGDSWEGDHKFRYTVGLKLNNVLKQNSRIFTGNIDFNPEFTDEDFKSRYLSLRLSVGLIIKGNNILDLVYDHALQNILARENTFSVSKLVPFYLGLNLSHYL